MYKIYLKQCVRRHGFFGFWVAARTASTNMSSKPSFFNAEHSRLFTALIFLFNLFASSCVTYFWSLSTRRSFFVPKNENNSVKIVIKRFQRITLTLMHVNKSKHNSGRINYDDTKYVILNFTIMTFVKTQTRLLSQIYCFQ